MSTSLARPAGRIGFAAWLLSALLFGLIGPVFLSIYYAGSFHGRTEPFSWHGYPWPFPLWAYGITFIKTASLIVWLGLRTRSPARLSWLAGLLAGVFLLGAGHALACAVMNGKAFEHGAWFGSHVVLAYLACLIYLWNCVLALLWGRSGGIGLLLGLLAGLAFVAGFPAAAECVAFGLP